MKKTIATWLRWLAAKFDPKPHTTATTHPSALTPAEIKPIPTIESIGSAHATSGFWQREDRTIGRWGGPYV